MTTPREVMTIQVPHDVTRKPGSFAEMKHWKAKEWKRFLLYTGKIWKNSTFCILYIALNYIFFIAIPLLRGKLQPSLYLHFAMLSS